MSFWDGERWVLPSADAPTARSRARLRDWAATLAIVVAFTVAAIPIAGASASGPRLSMSPSTGAAGSSVKVSGASFDAKTKVQLTWDGSAAGMPTANVTGRGTFQVSLTVPPGADGPHTIAAVQVVTSTGKLSKIGKLGALLATTVFTLSSTLTAAASPTPTPTPAPTATPTATPTPTPTPTPAPTATPTPAPSASQAPASPAPTATPTPTATPAPTSTATATPSASAAPPKILFGLGTQVESARSTAIAKNAPIEIYSSWYNGPNDLGWITDSWHRSIYQSVYGSGHSIHLITWTDLPETTFSTDFGTACGRAYPLSARWTDDMRQLAQAFAGPAGGPTLYVTLFTEFQTYPCTDNAWSPNAATTNYYRALKAQYEAGLAIFHQYAPNAKVSLGWGGWQSRWDDPSIDAGRSMIPDFADVMNDSDFVSFQAMAGDSNVSDIRSMTRILGAYRPVMIAHHMPDADTNSGTTVDDTFSADVHTLMTDGSIAALKSDGLFAWNLMHDGPLTRSASLYDFVAAAINRYGGG